MFKSKMKLRIYISLLLLTLTCATSYAQRFSSRSSRNRYDNKRVSNIRMGMGQFNGLDYSIGQFLTHNDGFSVSAESWASVSSNGDLRPLLSYSNEWGRYTQYKQGEFGVLAGVKFKHRMVDNRFGFETGVTGELHTDTKRIMFNQAYLNFDIWMAQVRFGLQEYTPIETNTDLSIGSFVASNNAHVIPRIWVGIMDWWSPLSLVKARGFNCQDAFDLRFGMSYGRMDDEGDELATDDLCLHEKFFYFRVSQWFIKPYLGMYHSAMTGGVTAWAEEIPVDIPKTFFGKKGRPSKFTSNSFTEELATPAGANQGLWDIGFDFESPIGDGKLYYQRPHADGQSRAPFGSKAKDFTIGLQMNLDVKDFPYINAFTLEFATTKWQGGDNMNIPCVPDQEGGYSFIYLDALSSDDIAELKESTLDMGAVDAWEAANGEITSVHSLEKFLKETYNDGKDFGGRFQYLDNQFYRQGWTRRGLSMGNPLMHTRRTVRTYVGDKGNMQYLSAFPNTRVAAFNIGIKGNILPDKLDYLLRTTISKNYGNYNEQYMVTDSSCMSTNVKIDDYFFDKGKLEVYTKLEAKYILNDWLTIKGNISFDMGDLYSSFAFRAGVTYFFGEDNITPVTKSPNTRSNRMRGNKTQKKANNLSSFHRGR